MDAETLNKIIGSLLAALLLIFAPKVFIEMNMKDHGDSQEIAGYTLAAEEKSEHEAAKSSTTDAAPAFDAAAVVAAAEGAKVDAGAKFFKKCKACHSVTDGGKHKVGPNLWGIVGRSIGGADGFNYSAAAAQKGGNWTLEALAEFLHAPESFLPETKMSFGGVSKDKDLANLLAYLKSLQ